MYIYIILKRFKFSSCMSASSLICILYFNFYYIYDTTPQALCFKILSCLNKGCDDDDDDELTGECAQYCL